jgi:hypothetical protein
LIKVGYTNNDKDNKVWKTSLINKVGKKLKENGVKKVRNTLISRPFQGQVKVSQGIILIRFLGQGKYSSIG